MVTNCCSVELSVSQVKYTKNPKIATTQQDKLDFLTLFKIEIFIWQYYSWDVIKKN